MNRLAVFMQNAKQDLERLEIKPEIVEAGFLTWENIVGERSPAFKGGEQTEAAYRFFEGLGKQAVWAQMELLFQLAIVRGNEFPPGDVRLHTFIKMSGD